MREVGSTPARYRSLSETKHVHCVGIGGAGVQALAELFIQSGARVSGSDRVQSRDLERLRRLGAQVAIGHDALNVPPETSQLVYSPAIGWANRERCFAREQGIPEYSYPEMLGRLMDNRHGIAVAGTHGKSTTTAMTGWVLVRAGLDPTVIVGASVPQLRGSSRVGQGQPFVVESCEYGRSFHHLEPRAAAVLNIEPDHLDYYSGLDEVIEAFRGFVDRVPPEGLVVSHGSSEAVRMAVAGARARIETFSLDPGSTWWGADLREERGCYRFRVFYRGEYTTQILLQVPGRHNVENALAAIALARSLGVAPTVIRDALEEFSGCRRRFELRGSWRGVTLVDDYAHHPSEIQVTLETVRRMYGNRRLWCAFQPHQVTRTEKLFGRFAESFKATDHVLVADVYAAREPAGQRAASLASRLAEAIAAGGAKARYVGGLGMITAYLEENLKPGDVLLTMGAGDIWKVADAFARRVSRYRKAG